MRNAVLNTSTYRYAVCPIIEAALSRTLVLRTHPDIVTFLGIYVHKHVATRISDTLIVHEHSLYLHADIRDVYVIA